MGTERDEQENNLGYYGSFIGYNRLLYKRDYTNVNGKLKSIDLGK